MIAVYDLGGGTFDISILDVGDGVLGARHSGRGAFYGDDFDLRVMDYLIEQFKKDNSIDLHRLAGFATLERGGGESQDRFLRRCRPRSTCLT